MVLPAIPGGGSGPLFPPVLGGLSAIEKAAFVAAARQLNLSTQKRQTMNDVFLTHTAELGERSAAEFAVRATFNSLEEQRFFNVVNFFIQNPVLLGVIGTGL
jgi:hypothetical protein